MVGGRGWVVSQGGAVYLFERFVLNAGALYRSSGV